MPAGYIGGSTGGASNGPTLCAGTNCTTAFGDIAYEPTAIGDTVSFSGFSQTFVSAGDLKWSNLFSSSGATDADFETAVPSTVPGPASAVLLIGGLALGGMMARRRA